MITVTDIHAGHAATIHVADFTDTVTAWFEDAPQEILDAIDDVQDQLDRGQFITGSAVDSLGLTIVAGDERKLWDLANDEDTVLRSVDVREPYEEAIAQGSIWRREATDREVTADTLTVDLVQYTEPHTGETRFAVHHNDPSTAIAWDYPTEDAATARFENHVQRLTETGAVFVADDDDDEVSVPTVTPADVIELLGSTADEPVMYVDDIEGEMRVRVWASALAWQPAVIVTKEAALNDLGLDEGAPLSAEDHEYIVAEIVPALQNEVAKIVETRYR